MDQYWAPSAKIRPPQVRIRTHHGSGLGTPSPTARIGPPQVRVGPLAARIRLSGQDWTPQPGSGTVVGQDWAPPNSQSWAPAGQDWAPHIQDWGLPVRIGPQHSQDGVPRSESGPIMGQDQAPLQPGPPSQDQGLTGRISPPPSQNWDFPARMGPQLGLGPLQVRIGPLHSPELPPSPSPTSCKGPILPQVRIAPHQDQAHHESASAPHPQDKIELGVQRPLPQAPRPDPDP